jgi:multiple sugar transport system substrate-binding protein
MSLKKGTALVLCLLVFSGLAFASGSRQAPSDKLFAGTVVNALLFTSLDAEYIVNVLAPKLKAETGIELRVDQVPYEDIRARQLADATGAKRYDIINPCTEWSYEYAQFATPLTKYIGMADYPNVELDDMIPYVWEEFNGGKDVYWFPYQPDTRIFFYRTDLLSAEGLSEPKTWTDVLNAAKAMTKDTNGDGRIDQYGFGFPARRGWNLTLAWAPLLFAAGGELFDANNQPVFNSQAGIDAINFLIELKKYCPPDIDAYGEHELNDNAKNGLIAMGISASGITPELEVPGIPVKGKIKSIPFPVQPGATAKYSACLGGWAFGVSSYSKKMDAAAYTVMWLTDRTNVADMQINGRQHASRLSQATNPQLLAVNPHVSAIVSILEKSVIFYHGVEGAQIGELLNVRIAQAVSGEMGPKEALDTAIRDIAPLIKK